MNLLDKSHVINGHVVIYVEDVKTMIEGMICCDCGEFNCDCDWYVLNRKNRELMAKIKELENQVGTKR